MKSKLDETGSSFGAARRPRSLETERRLKAAALDLLAEGGLSACTATALADRAGVAVGTIYARFADKDALLAEALLTMVSLDDGAQDLVFRAIANEADNLSDFLRQVIDLALTVTVQQRTFLLAVREFRRSHADPVWREAFRLQQSRGRTQLLAGAVERFGGEARGGPLALQMALTAIYGAVEAAWLDPEAPLFQSALSRRVFGDALAEMQIRYLS